MFSSPWSLKFSSRKMFISFKVRIVFLCCQSLHQIYATIHIISKSEKICVLSVCVYTYICICCTYICTCVYIQIIPWYGVQVLIVVWISRSLYGMDVWIILWYEGVDHYMTWMCFTVKQYVLMSHTWNTISFLPLCH